MDLTNDLNGDRYKSQIDSIQNLIKRVSNIEEKVSKVDKRTCNKYEIVINMREKIILKKIK